MSRTTIPVECTAPPHPTILHRRTVNVALLGSLLTAACGGGGTSDLQILEHPKDVTAERGATVNFSVTLSNAADAVYQWKQNGIDLPGANQPTLTLRNIQDDLNGVMFNVEISSPSGKIASRIAKLTINTTYGIAPFPLLDRTTVIGMDRNGSFFAIRRPSDRDGAIIYKLRPDGTEIKLSNNLDNFTIPQITSSGSPYVQATDALNGEIYITQIDLNFSLNNERPVAGRIYKISGTGAVQVLFESREIFPAGIAFDRNGEVVTLDLARNSLYEVNGSGGLTKVVDLSPVPSFGQWIPSRRVWLANTKEGVIYAGISSPEAYDAVMVTLDKQVHSFRTDRRIVGLGVYGSSGYVLEEDLPGGRNKTIRKLNPDRTSTIVAGSPGANGESLLGALPGRLRDVSWASQGPDGKIYLYGSSQSVVVVAP